MYCGNCGAPLQGSADFCDSCGKPVRGPVFLPKGREAIFLDDSNSYINMLYNSGQSTAFAVGSIMFAGAMVLSNLITFSVLAVFLMGIAVLPLIALLIIYKESKTRKNPLQILTAMTLLKVHTVIGIVLYCVAMANVLILIGVFWIGFPGSGLGAIFLFIIAISVVFLRFYYVALLRIIQDIRNGVTRNEIKPLRSVLGFTVVAGIAAASSALNVLPVMTITRVDMNNIVILVFTQMLPPEISGFFERFLPTGGQLMVGGLLSLVSSAGIVILLVTLNQFNGKLKSQSRY